jgi:ABC-type dipeptide/oligopeptide/nickel transport system permease subunit
MHDSPNHAPATARNFAAGYVFGVPLGNMGWFASLLMGVASGFMAFFASTLCAILFILLYNSFARSPIDFALSYRLIGLPIGLVVMVLALGTLAILWFRRILRRN